MNICSVIVSAKPEKSHAISQLLEEMEGIDVFGGVDEGKIIATLEDSGEKALADKMAAINNLKGVINATMIYHQEADIKEMEEEIV
ncbi:chaperone NapD [sulfur-oxidizing endosymbiont of Gigantopelta aegis]|uniref:chaperone NapD n=1 Tax=sulfur-oxidizing endosymbiont of Gigantopelta aegis TaxID=2794934 RepID=UPI002483CF7B|nr:chaperone NapD [sulfur-oxidizing endosymbiont of Gigantopelta aegis]